MYYTAMIRRSNIVALMARSNCCFTKSSWRTEGSRLLICHHIHDIPCICVSRLSPITIETTILLRLASNIKTSAKKSYFGEIELCQLMLARLSAFRKTRAIGMLRHVPCPLDRKYPFPVTIPSGLQAQAPGCPRR